MQRVQPGFCHEPHQHWPPITPTSTHKAAAQEPDFITATVQRAFLLGPPQSQASLWGMQGKPGKEHEPFQLLWWEGQPKLAQTPPTRGHLSIPFASVPKSSEVNAFANCLVKNFDLSSLTLDSCCPIFVPSSFYCLSTCNG